MNLVKNKKKDVKQFLEEMKANKTNRSTNKQSFNSQMIGSSSNKNINDDYDNFNSNGFSRKVNQKSLCSRKVVNYNSNNIIPNFNNSQSNNFNISQMSQRNSMNNFNNFNGSSQLNRINQFNSLQQHPIKRNQSQIYSPYQSNPNNFIYQRNISVQAPMSQNLMRTYSSQQLNHYPSQKYYDQYSNNNQDRRSLHSQSSQSNSPLSFRHLSKDFNYSCEIQSQPIKHVNLDSQKFTNPNYFQIQNGYMNNTANSTLIKPMINHRINNTIIHQNIVQKKPSYLNQQLPIKKSNNFAQINSINSCMQRIPQVSIDQSSSSNDTPGKILQSTIKKQITQNDERRKSKTPINKLIGFQDQKVQNFQQANFTKIKNSPIIENFQFQQSQPIQKLSKQIVSKIESFPIKEVKKHKNNVQNEDTCKIQSNKTISKMQIQRITQMQVSIIPKTNQLKLIFKQKQKQKLMQILSESQKVNQALDNIINDLKILENNLNRDQKDFSKKLEKNGIYHKYIKLNINQNFKIKSLKNKLFNLSQNELQEAVQIQKISYDGNELEQFEF